MFLAWFLATAAFTEPLQIKILGEASWPRTFSPKKRATPDKKVWEEDIQFENDQKSLEKKFVKVCLHSSANLVALKLCYFLVEKIRQIEGEIAFLVILVQKKIVNLLFTECKQTFTIFFHLLQNTVIYFDVNLYKGCPFS